MNKQELIRRANLGLLKLKKKSPDIMIVVGAIGVVGAAVMACRATLKVNDIIDDSKEKIEKIHRVYNDKELAEKNNYTEKDMQSDLFTVYVQTGWQLVKLYAPSVALGALSISAIAASHNIMSKRNAALAAAYTALSDDYEGYRNRVIDRFGAQVDRELKHNIRVEEITEEVTDPETGETRTETRTIEVAAPTDSAYTRIFDEYNDYWQKDYGMNQFFLNSELEYANNMLRTRGYLFLNDVLVRLGYPPTNIGSMVGWIYDPSNPNRDCFVDFGLNRKDRATELFNNEAERSVILEFNVDGLIYDQIEKFQKVFANK